LPPPPPTHTTTIKPPSPPPLLPFYTHPQPPGPLQPPAARHPPTRAPLVRKGRRTRQPLAGPRAAPAPGREEILPADARGAVRRWSIVDWGFVLFWVVVGVGWGGCWVRWGTYLRGGRPWHEDRSFTSSRIYIYTHRRFPPNPLSSSRSFHSCSILTPGPPKFHACMRSSCTQALCARVGGGGPPRVPRRRLRLLLPPLPRCVALCVALHGVVLGVALSLSLSPAFWVFFLYFVSSIGRSVDRIASRASCPESWPPFVLHLRWLIHTTRSRTNASTHLSPLLHHVDPLNPHTHTPTHPHARTHHLQGSPPRARWRWGKTGSPSASRASESACRGTTTRQVSQSSHKQGLSG
jgi:hypothetical protein